MAIMYTDEQKQFLKDNYQNVSHKKLTDMFNQMFGTNKTVKAIESSCNIWGFVKYNAEEPYTDEQKQFLKDNYQNVSHKELTDMFNQRFGTNKSVATIKTCCKIWGCVKYKAKDIQYTKEQKQFLKDNYQNVSYKELADMFNQRFGTNKSVEAINLCCNNLGFVKLYTKEQKQFLKDNYQNVSHKELTDMFNQRFGTNKSVIAIESSCNIWGFVKYNAEEPYTDEQKQFLKDNYQDFSWNNLTYIFNQRFETNKSVHTIRTCCNSWGFVKYDAGIEFTPEELKFLKDNWSKDVPYFELTNIFNQRFNANRSEKTINVVCVCVLGLRKRYVKEKYTFEQKEFLKQNYKKYTIQKLTQKYNQIFNDNKSELAIKGKCEKLKLTKKFDRDER